MAPQGWLLSQTPSTDGRGVFQDPKHVSFWNGNSFWYYTLADQNRFIDYPVRFQANRLKNFLLSEWHREHQIVYMKADLLRVAGWPRDLRHTSRRQRHSHLDLLKSRLPTCRLFYPIQAYHTLAPALS